MHQGLTADSIYHLKEWTSEEQNLLSTVKKKLPNHIKLHSFYDQFLISPDEIKLPVKEIPLVFTQFRKWVEKHCTPQKPLKPISKLPSNLIVSDITLAKLEELGFSELTSNTKSAFPFKGGENQALDRIEHYFFQTKKLGVYKKTRNGLLGTDYSSKLSAWLANGSISARSIYKKVKEFEQDF